MEKKPILFLCNHTSGFTLNSGIQRTVRFLARSLQELGEEVIPVGLEEDDSPMYILDKTRLEFLSLYNGPSVDKWKTDLSVEEAINSAEFIIIPELIFYTTSKKIIELPSILKKYFIFYDIIPVLFPNLYGEDRKQSHLEYMNYVKKSDGVLCISHSAKKDFLTIMQPDSDIVTIPLPNQFIETENEISEKINNTKNINILKVATIEPRKNHKLLIEAFLMAKDELEKQGYSLQLDLVGEPWQIEEFHNLIDYAHKTGCIKFHYKVTDDELIEFYKNADFTVYSSIYEGYGLPIVESLSLNTPCIVSNTSSMTEIAEKGGCLLFESNNVEQLKDQIIYLATNPDIRQELVAEIKNIPKYTWSDYAKNILLYIRKGN